MHKIQWHLNLEVFYFSELLREDSPTERDKSASKSLSNSSTNNVEIIIYINKKFSSVFCIYHLSMIGIEKLQVVIRWQGDLTGSIPCTYGSLIPKCIELIVIFCWNIADILFYYCGTTNKVCGTICSRSSKVVDGGTSYRYRLNSIVKQYKRSMNQKTGSKGFLRNFAYFAHLIWKKQYLGMLYIWFRFSTESWLKVFNERKCEELDISVNTS